MRYTEKAKMKSQIRYFDRETINAVKHSLSEILQTVRNGDDDSRGYLAQLADAQLSKAYENLFQTELEELVADTWQTLRFENPILN